jgi:hypothetical protein
MISVMLYKDGKIKQIYDPKTTREDCIKWINEAETNEIRNLRKQCCQFKLYSGGTQSIQSILKKK